MVIKLRVMYSGAIVLLALLDSFNEYVCVHIQNPYMYDNIRVQKRLYCLEVTKNFEESSKA